MCLLYELFASLKFDLVIQSVFDKSEYSFGNNILDSVEFENVISDYDTFEHICADTFPDDNKRGLVAVVTVYFDATYNQPKANSVLPPVHTVGAYVATRANWRKFRKEWKIELGKKGLEYFHMTDFEFALSQVIKGNELPRKNVYYGWSKDELVSFLKRLHRTITRKSAGIYRLEGLASSVIKSDFDEAIPDELKDDVQCSSYYIFNVVTLMKGISLWANRHQYNDSIHYIFASGDGEGGNLERLFVDMWNDPTALNRFRLSKGYSHMPYGIEQMKGEPAIQAADIVAFDLHKNVLNWFEKGCVEHIPATESRKSLISLARANHYGWIYRKKEILESFADIVEANKNKLPRY